MNDETLIRLNKFLSQCGVGSRRSCDSLIEQGKIRINGIVVTKLGTRIDPIKDRVEVGTRTVKQVRSFEHFAYNKPRGVLVTASDPQGRTTIYDALLRQGIDVRHLKYSGRLDYESEGLLLLSNDGALIHGLTHPRFAVKKTYQIALERPLAEDERTIMVEKGVLSQNQLLRAGRIEAVHSITGESALYLYEVDLFEGKNRQIRRMFEAFGYNIVALKRIQYASVKLGDLPPDKIRSLTPREIAGLRNTGYPCNKDTGSL